jgi:hypothetical protein
MRTTLSIDDALLARAKARAAGEGVTLGQYVEESLRCTLATAAQESRRPVRLTTVGGTGPRPGVDLTDTGQLFELLDDEDLGR